MAIVTTLAIAITVVSVLSGWRRGVRWYEYAIRVLVTVGGSGIYLPIGAVVGLVRDIGHYVWPPPRWSEGSPVAIDPSSDGP